MLFSRWAGLGVFFWLVFAPPGVWDHPARYTIPRSDRVLHEPLNGDGTCHDARPSSPGELRRPCFEQALRGWVEARRDLWPDDRPMPVVIVATAGGASRAALWTLSVFRELDSASGGDFSRYLFAVSAVSGGALGAVTYMQARHAFPDPPATAPARSLGVDWARTTAALEGLASRDLLSASIATYFLNDTLAGPLGRLLPAGHDRGAMLEGAFRRYWEASFPTRPAPGLIGGLRPPHRADLPHLLLNGTDNATGRRAITATFRFRPEDEIFANADDLLTELLPPDGVVPRDRPCEDEPRWATEAAMWGQDIAAETAVLNAARFPYLSPAGRYNSRTIVIGCTKRHDMEERRKLLDGGYFENYGARTAAELAEAVNRFSHIRPGRLVPVIVVISNDADGWEQIENGGTRPEGAYSLRELTVSCQLAQRLSVLPDDILARRGGATELTQLLAPIAGLAATRSVHGQDALHILRRDHCSSPHAVDGDIRQQRRFVHIGLRRPQREGEAAPMNWVLNASAARLMLKAGFELDTFSHQEVLSFARMMDAIGAAPPTR